MTLKHLLKTAVLALFVTASVWAAGPSFAAGTLPLAMAQQIDVNGQPLANCQVNFYVAGTVATQAERLFRLWPLAAAGQSALLRPDRPHSDVLAGGRLDPRPADGHRRRPDHRHHHAGAGPVVRRRRWRRHGRSDHDPGDRRHQGALRHGDTVGVRPPQRAHDRQRDLGATERANADTQAAVHLSVHPTRTSW
jgi:hypothetical protein